MPKVEALVMDASVAINLNATRRAADIMVASPYSFLVTPNVRAEVRDTGARGRNDAAMLGELIDRGLVRCLDMPEDTLELYLSLVGGAASATLDDGEASTIVMARTIGAAAALDERKARALCATAFPSLPLVSSIDLLLSAEVRDRLGLEEQGEAVLSALRDARMQVRGDRLAAIVGLIGIDRLHDCPSLPLHIRIAATRTHDV